MKTRLTRFAMLLTALATLALSTGAGMRWAMMSVQWPL
jgi:hypothetical protein